MAAWDTPFVSPLQSTASKTSITQQSSCAQHTRTLERYTHLYIWRWVNWNTEVGSQGNSRDDVSDPSLLAVAAEPAAPKNLLLAEVVAHMTLVSRPQWCPWYQAAVAAGPVTLVSSAVVALPTLAAPHGGGHCEPENPGYGRDTQKLVSSPSSPPPWWKCLRPQWS